MTCFDSLSQMIERQISFHYKNYTLKWIQWGLISFICVSFIGFNLIWAKPYTQAGAGQDHPNHTSSQSSLLTNERSKKTKMFTSRSRQSTPSGKELLNNLSKLNFGALGHPATRWDSIPPVYAKASTPHQLLVVLVEFKDLKFERFAQDPQQAQKLQSYYQDYLFDPEYKKIDTLSHYYYAQSLGQYHLQGKVLPPITLDHSRAHYGRPKRVAGSDWRNDSEVEDLIEEVLRKVGKEHPKLAWNDFDQWDPKDHDEDGVLTEADGYLDHLVVVYAGGGQASCHSLYKLQDSLNPNVSAEALTKLSPEALACADRIWPHRFMIQRREDEGPLLTQGSHSLGGAPILNNLWAKDYNIQSEYTEIATFIHEFGHSIGLPDIYARATNNSTGQWEVMSHTSSPSPQSLSSWSRMVLGWLKPTVIMPPEMGGAYSQKVPLKILDDPRTDKTSSRAILVALPPQKKSIELTSLTKEQGTYALYSGQGNELNRTVRWQVDLPKIITNQTLYMTMKAWWEIEPGWDFAYMEIRSQRKGSKWQRLVSKPHMHAKHGHDGPKSLPGFTGFSGDLDGDGKNENHPQCDPKKKLKHGEDKKERSACQKGTWTHVLFDLSVWQGDSVQIRLRYFSDMAAVEKGILIDELEIGHKEAQKTVRVILKERFESDKLDPRIQMGDFLRSQGAHHFEVPHFYMIEYRDPYSKIDKRHRYDQALAKTRPIIYFDPQTNTMKALTMSSSAGAIIWYANGSYAWSENEPTQNGPGKGFLLAIDAHPHELKIPTWAAEYKGSVEQFDTHYKIAHQQKTLKQSALKTMCAVRTPKYYPPNLPKSSWEDCAGASIQQIRHQDKQAKFVYEIINELLPGKARDPYIAVSELYDYKKVKGKLQWRLKNRSLRSLHLKDAPFNSQKRVGLTFYDVTQDKLSQIQQDFIPPVTEFNDLQKQRWQNPHLRFGGVQVPPYGLKIKFTPPLSDKKTQAKSWVEIQWKP
jgi:immune inhibitor A